MKNESSPVDDSTPLRPRSLVVEVAFSSISAAIGSGLFVMLLFVEGTISRNLSVAELADMDIGTSILILFLIVGPVVGTAIALIPSILCGVMVSSFIQFWAKYRGVSLALALLSGMIVGSIMGSILIKYMFIEQMGSDGDDLVVLILGAAAGLFAGGLYGWIMLSWLSKGNNSQTKR